MSDNVRGEEPLGTPLEHAVARWRTFPEQSDRDARLRATLRARLAGAPTTRARGGRRRGRLWAYTTAIAAALALAVSLEYPRWRGGLQLLTPDLATAAVPVVFAVDAGDARRVSLVGDFNGWSEGGVALTRSGNRWSVTLPLAAGRYAYTFRVDDRWMADELAPRAPQDFGPPASILIVSNGRLR